ncbi:hypothetical protein H0H92_007468 [Tricholoma furcatifolium]|nr:hypothetical protein H0H92_007468 [Tricholoma furcatifolium]
MQTPSFSLAPELVDSILSCLTGTSAIAKCALVCRSWVPHARYHLLPPPKVLRLHHKRIPGFLNLVDSPLSTLSFLFFTELRIDQGGKWSEVEPETRSRTAAGDFLARNLPLPSVQSLFLSFIDWKRLPQPALISLHTNYRFVKELKLRFIASITFPEFCGFLIALTSLEKITVDAGVPFEWDSPWPDFVMTSGVKITHPNLCRLVFINPSLLSLKQCFARAISCQAGIDSLSFTESLSLDHNGPQFQACGELLEAAGTSLRNFNFKVFSYTLGPYSDASEGSFADLVMLPRNTNLEEIEVGPSLTEVTLKLLLQGLKSSPKPALRRLKFGLRDGRDGWETWDWMPVDETLSLISMSLKSDHELIIDLPRFSTGWKYKSRDAELRVREKAYLQEISDKLKHNLLPRTVQRWKIIIRLQAWLFEVQVDDVERYLTYEVL